MKPTGTEGRAIVGHLIQEVILTTVQGGNKEGTQQVGGVELQITTTTPKEVAPQ